MAINISVQAKEILQHAIVCDMALGFEPEIEYPKKWEALQRYVDAGFSYISLHVATVLLHVI